MPLNQLLVTEAIANGVSAVCATCTHYWTASDQHRSSCGHPQCGGPIGGGVFPEYNGPMKDALHRFCFVCGTQSKYGIRVNGNPKIIGVCKEHFTYVRDYQRTGGPPTVVLETRGDGAPDLSKPRKKTLSQTIADFDRLDAEKAGE